MLYICIPVHNEAPTIGVLLWRLRGAFQEFAREYELVVYDDGSTDATAEVLEPYTRVLPLTVLSGRERRGYAAALDALARHVAAHTRYPRRDAMILMEGDFTDRPEHIPELVKRFEGGADVVVTDRRMGEKDPTSARRLRRLAPWLLRPFVRIAGVDDLTSTYRLIRISALRDLLRERGDAPIVSAEGWAANAALLVALAPHARRIESLPVEPRYEVRPRESRVRTFADAMALARFAWRARLRGGAAQRAAVAAPARPAAESPPELSPSVSVPQLALTDTMATVTPPKRRSRSRRDSAPADRPAADRPAAEPRVPADASASPSDAPLDDAEALEKRRRRRRARKAARADASPAIDDAAESAPAPAEHPADAPSDVAGEDAAPARARRSRRSRKRAAGPPATGDAESTAGADGATNASPAAAERSPRAERARRPDDYGEPRGAAPGSEPTDRADAADAEGGADGGDSADGTPAAKRRRSRRGRRRGARAAGDAPGGDSGGAGGGDAPSSEPSPAGAPPADAP